MLTRRFSVFTSAETYSTYQPQQNRDADAVLQKYSTLFRRNSKQSVLDVGCGTGDITFKYLLPMIKEQGKLVAGDISERMVEFASSNYKDPRLNFEVMDISDQQYGEKYASSFDTVFSSYCLNWIPDQWTTMKNIYAVLKPGGDAILILLGSHANDRLFEIIGGQSRWSTYLKNYGTYISHYRSSTDPLSEISKLMKSFGFEVLESTCTSTSFTYPSEEIFLKSMEAVNPLRRHIPQHLVTEFNKEYNETMRASNCYTLLDTNEAVFKYTLITIHARKPS